PHMTQTSLTTSRYYQRLCALLLLARVRSDELISDLIEGRELDAVVRLEVLDETLQHELYLRAARDIGVQGDGEDRVIVLAVDPIELVAPKIFNITRADKAVAVRRGLDEHHWWKIIEVPAGRNL